MASNIANSFITQYADEVKLAYQQKAPKLFEAGRKATNVIGSTYNFHTMGKVVANSKALDGDITLLNPAQAQVSCTLADKYAGVLIGELDQLKTNIDARRSFVETAAAAISRSIDEVIITALATATTTTETTTGGLTIAKILEARLALDLQDVDPEDRFLVVSPKQIGDLMAITAFTSADWAGLAQVDQNNIGSAYGFTIIKHTGLPLATVNRTCFAFNKQALGIAVGQDIKTVVERVAMKNGDLATTTVSLGAVIIDQLGVYKINCVE